MLTCLPVQAPTVPRETLCLIGMNFAGDWQNEVALIQSDTPWNLLEYHPLLGLGTNETLAGIDYWGGQIYGVGTSNHLYTVNPHTGQLTPVGSGPFTPALNGHSFSFGVENGPGGLSVVSDTGQSLTLARSTGAASANPPLAYAPGDVSFGASPFVTALAYDGASTRWYACDKIREKIVLLDPMSGLLQTIGNLGFSPMRYTGMDISPCSGSAYMVGLDQERDVQANLYTVHKETGWATLIGQIGSPGDNTLVWGLTVIPNCSSLEFSVTSNRLEICWPPAYSGWSLQVQTNTLSGGLGTGWHSLPATANTNCFVTPFDQGAGAVFYRLAFP